MSTRSNVVCRLCLNVPISGTKELASRTSNIAWRTRSDTFVLFPLLELTRAVAQHHAGFFGNYICVRECTIPLVIWPFFDCLFIDSFCDLCPTRHHKRGASRDHSQQNSSIALLLSPCFRGTSDESNDVAEGVTVGAGSACPSNAACHSDDRNNLIFSRFLSTAVLTLNTLDLCSFASLSPCPF